MQRSYNLFNAEYGSKAHIELPKAQGNPSLSGLSSQIQSSQQLVMQSEQVTKSQQQNMQLSSRMKQTNNMRILNEDRIGTKQSAMSHCLGIKVGKPYDGPQDVCSCCLRKIDLPLKWNFNPEDIGFLGVGYPQFYVFIKYCIFIVFAIIISSSSFNVSSNAMLGSDCYPDEMIDEEDLKTGDVCQYSWTTYFSLANKRNLPPIMSMQQMLNLFTIFTVIILLFKARIKFFLLTQNFTSLFCPSAYTVFIQNIPNYVLGTQGLSVERLIANTVTNKFGVRPKYVNVCWNLSDIHKIEKEKDELICQLQQKILDLPEGSQNTQKTYLEQIYQAKEEKFKQGFEIKKRLSQNLTEDNLIKYFTGKVFIVFDRVEVFIGDYYDNSVYPPVLLKNNEEKKRKGVTIKQAVPPNEIIWENAQYSNQFVRKRKFLFWGASILCMIVCYMLIGAILQCQRMFQSSKLGLLTNDLWVKSFAILVSLLIYVLNTVLRYFLSYFNQETYFTLRTEASCNMAGKLAIAYFLNSGIMSFLIDVIIPRFTKENGIQAARIAIYRNGGLIFNMQYIFVTNAIIIPLLQMIDVSMIFKLYYQWKMDKKLNNKTIPYMYTQKQLNDYPVSDLVYDYALIISQMYFMAFYSPLIPIGTGTTLFTLIAFYFIHKFKLAKHKSLLNNVGSELCVEMTEMLEMIVPIYSFSNLLFEYMLSEDNYISTYATIGFIVGILNAALPMDKLKDMFLDIDQNEFLFKKPTYDEIKDKFETDYNKENPITKDVYLRLIQDSHRKSEEDEEQEKRAVFDKKTFKSFQNIAAQKH